MNLRDPGDDKDDIEDSDIAQTVYDLDCEEILRDLAFIDSDAEILKWARVVKSVMWDLAVEAKADSQEEE
jgi:hypothetical protein